MTDKQKMGLKNFTRSSSDASKLPVAMTIAGSDSGGGAGIQADLKTFAALGVHGTTVITALTAQNTVQVKDVLLTTPTMIRAQAEAILADMKVDAVKIGMLGNQTTIEAVAAVLDMLPSSTPVIHDPVMVAESGARLLEWPAVETLVKHIVPKATVVTPNLAEAGVLAAFASGRDLSAVELFSPQELVQQIYSLGSSWVLLTGGHLNQAVDTLFDGKEFYDFPGERYPDGAAHGSGCTHSSVLAASLAHGMSMPSAARVAKDVAAHAVCNGLREIGSGAGPVDVMSLKDPPLSAYLQRDGS